MQVPPRSLVLGVPGRVVRQVDDRLAAMITGTWQHYIGQAKAHRAGKFPLYQPSE
jgi:carbonic anhydrase/acetyltransferase-like protein (isoleucine patch superfamily)